MAMNRAAQTLTAILRKLRKAVSVAKEKKEPADKPGSVEDDHPSGTAVTSGLKQPTRKRGGRRYRSVAGPDASLFGLAPGGVFRAAACYHPRGALLPHHFTLTPGD